MRGVKEEQRDVCFVLGLRRDAMQLVFDIVVAVTYGEILGYLLVYIAPKAKNF